MSRMFMADPDSTLGTGHCCVLLFLAVYIQITQSYLSSLALAVLKSRWKCIYSYIDRVSYRGGPGRPEIFHPQLNPPPTRNLKINDVIIKMYDFSP